MIVRAVRKVSFCAGHRLLGHEGLCASFHGHNYTAYIHVSAPQLDSVGRVIDFSIIKERLGRWIDDNWDHAFILSQADEEGRRALSGVSEQRVFLLENNPTVENMARYLFSVVAPRELSDFDVMVDRIVLWETENCFAEVSR